MVKAHQFISNRRHFLVAFLFSGFAFSSLSQDPGISEAVAYRVTDAIYVHEMWGANLTILSGKDGLLIIDTGYPAKAAYSDSVICARFKKQVKYVVNTHFHFDHVGGNNLFADEGAIIVAHVNTRERMMKEWNVQRIAEELSLKYPVIPPYSVEFLPELCFQDSLDIHLNEQLIRLIHIPGGHTDSDVVAVFKDRNVIQTGDLFLTNSYPPIGGSVAGYLDAIKKILEMCDENTIVIPGHGPLSDRNGLRKYHELISSASDRIWKLKEEGKNLKEVLDSKPLEGLLPVKSYAPENLFIYCVYNDGVDL